jgi:hypothetical protein
MGLQDALLGITPQIAWQNSPYFYNGFCLGLDIAIVRNFLAPASWVVIEDDDDGTFFRITDGTATVIVDPSDEGYSLKLLGERHRCCEIYGKSMSETHSGARKERKCSFGVSRFNDFVDKIDVPILRNMRGDSSSASFRWNAKFGLKNRDVIRNVATPMAQPSTSVSTHFGVGIHLSDQIEPILPLILPHLETLINAASA